MRRKSRTLVVHTGGIGDLLLATPALIALSRAGPLELLGQPDRDELLVAGGIAEAAHDIDAVSFHTLFSEPCKRLRTFLKRYGRAIVWMRDDGKIRSALESCGISEVEVIPGVPEDSWAEHASLYYLRSLGWEEAVPLHLAIPPQGSQLDVVIHPGSGSRRKNWPLANFASLAEALAMRGLSVAWCTGPAEETLSLPGEHAELASLPLVDLAGRLARTRLYVGNDCGITHLAAAVGCRTIAVFGPTDPRVWAPLGGHVTVVRSEPWPGIAEVLRACSQSFPERRV